MDKLHIVKLGGGLLESSENIKTALSSFMLSLGTKFSFMEVAAKPVHSVKNSA